jgi:hypothetical protein
MKASIPLRPARRSAGATTGSHLRGKNAPTSHSRPEPRRWGLATRRRALAAQARVALEDADATVRRKVIDLLDIRVHIA